MEPEVVVHQAHPFDDGYDDERDDVVVQQYHSKSSTDDNEPSVHDLYHHHSRFDNNIIANAGAETVHQRMLDDDDDDAVFSPSARATGSSKPGFFATNMLPDIDVIGNVNAKSALQASLAAGNDRRWSDVGRDEEMCTVNVDVDDASALHVDAIISKTNMRNSSSNHFVNCDSLAVGLPPPVTVSPPTKSGGREKDAQMSKDRLLCMHYANFRRDINPTTGHLSFMSDCLYCHRTIAGVQKYVWRRSCIRHLENIHKKLVSEPGFRPIGGNPGEARFSEQGDIIFTDNDAIPAASLMPAAAAPPPAVAPPSMINGSSGDLVDVSGGDSMLGRASYMLGGGADASMQQGNDSVHFSVDEIDTVTVGDGGGGGVGDDQNSSRYSDDGDGGTLLGRDDLLRANGGIGAYLPLPPAPPVGTDLSTAELVLDHYSNLRQEERTKGRVYVADCKYCRKAIVGHEKPTQVGHFREHTKKRHIDMQQPQQGGSSVTQSATPTSAEMLKNSVIKNLSFNNLSMPTLIKPVTASNINQLGSYQPHFGVQNLFGHANSTSSLMWHHYFEDPVHDGETDTYKAICKLCKVLVGGSRRLSMFHNFSHHLRDQHKFKVSDSGAVLDEPNSLQLFGQTHANSARDNIITIKDELDVVGEHNISHNMRHTPSFSDAFRSTMTFAAQLAAAASGTVPPTTTTSFNAISSSPLLKNPMADLASRVLQKSQKLKTFGGNNNGMSSDCMNNMALTVTVDSDDNSTPSKFGGSGDDRNGSASPTALDDKMLLQHSYSQRSTPTHSTSGRTNGGGGDMLGTGGDDTGGVDSGGDYDADTHSPGKMKKREEDNLIRQRVLEHYIVGQGQTSAGSSCCVGKCRHCNVTVTTSRKHIHIPKFTAHLSRHHPDVFGTLGITLEHNRTKITKKKKKSGSSLKSAHLIMPPSSGSSSGVGSGVNQQHATTTISTQQPKLNGSSHPSPSMNGLMLMNGVAAASPQINLTGLVAAAAAAAAANNNNNSSPLPPSSMHNASHNNNNSIMLDVVNSGGGSSNAMSDFAHKFLSVVQQQQQQNQLLNAAAAVANRRKNTDSPSVHNNNNTVGNNNNSAFTSPQSSSSMSSSAVTAAAAASLLGKAATTYLLNAAAVPSSSSAVAALQQQQQQQQNRSNRHDSFLSDFGAAISRSNSTSNTTINSLLGGGSSSNMPHANNSNTRNINNLHFGHQIADNTNSRHADAAHGVDAERRERSLIMLRYPFSHPHDPCDKCYLMVPTVAANEVPTEKIRDLKTILDREGRKLDSSGSTYEIARDGITVLNKLESINFRVASMAVNATEYFWTLRSET